MSLTRTRTQSKNTSKLANPKVIKEKHFQIGVKLKAMLAQSTMSAKTSASLEKDLHCYFLGRYDPELH